MKRSLRSWLWRVPLDEEVDEELAFHIEMRTRELVDRGMSASEARRHAVARLGNLADVRQTCLDEGRRRNRTMRMTQWIGELGDDLKFGCRQLVGAPVFALVSVFTLALGIGANSAIFALVDTTLLRPLPLPDPGRLVMVWEKSEASPQGSVSPLNMADWQARSRSFEEVGGFVPYVGGMVMAGADGNAETVPRQWVTAGIFRALGIRPVAGRTFLPEDDAQRANVVVLSEPFWRARFGGDPSVVGRAIRLDGAPFTIVGVVPGPAQLIGEASVWALRSFPPRPALRGARMLAVVARLRPGVSVEAAAADLSAVAEGLAREFPATNAGRGVAMAPLHEALIGRDLRFTSMLFLGVVGLVLLICCANVASLLMARATARTRELGIRSALGAGRRRIVRQLLTESLLLSAIGGALGAVVGAGILAVAPSVIPEGLLPRAVALSFDGRVVAFCAAAALAVGVLFGLAPAWQASGLTAAQAITSEGRTTTSRGGRVRSVLVAGEVATAVVLLFGAGLLLRTLVAVDSVDRGYRARDVITMMVDPLGSRYPTPESLLQFFDTIARETKAIPGVRSTAWASTLPMGESVLGDASIEIEGVPPPAESARPAADVAVVSPTYFETLDLPLVAGRGFDEHDTLQSTAVCVVNEAFVRQVLGGRSPIGIRVVLRPADQPQAKPLVREIVGVARQVKRRPDEREAFLQIYVPLAQSPVDDMFLAIRPASGQADALAAPLRAAIGRVDKEQLVSVRDILTLDDVAWDVTSRQRFRAVMVATFASLALVLAMVGIFGILAYSVQQRARDLALRRALGATTSDVLRLVAASAVRVIAAGAAIGLVLAVALARLVTTMLFGVTPLDPLTFALVLLVLALTGLVAVAGPAWRAAHIDPAVALRDV
jgi:putative ABC transport system permease protein